MAQLFGAGFWFPVIHTRLTMSRDATPQITRGHSKPLREHLDRKLNNWQYVLVLLTVDMGFDHLR